MAIQFAFPALQSLLTTITVSSATSIAVIPPPWLLLLAMIILEVTTRLRESTTSIGVEGGSLISSLLGGNVPLIVGPQLLLERCPCQVLL